MSWFSLALSSAFSNSVVNVIDKIVVERYRPLSYLGIVLSVCCSALLSMEQAPHARRRALNPVLLMTLASTMLRSLGDLFIKVTLGGQDYWNTFGLSRAALLPITGLLL